MKCHNITEIFRNSSVAMNVLNAEQDRLYNKRLNLRASNDTRWNSKYEMAKRILEIKEAISSAYDRMRVGSNDQRSKANDLEPHILEDQEIEALGEIIAILKPLAEFTNWAGRIDNPTISKIYPTVLTILNDLPTHALQARTLHTNLERRIRETWNILDIPDSVLIVTFLNPVFSHHYILEYTTTPEGTTLFSKAKKLTTTELTVVLVLEKKKEMEKDKAKSSTNQRTNKKNEEANLSLQSIRAKFIVEAYCLLAESIGEDEELRKKYADNPLEYWSEIDEGHELQYLALLAKKFMCIQATSCESERLFSRLKHTLEDRQNLSDNNLQDLLYYNSFYQLLPIIKQ